METGNRELVTLKYSLIRTLESKEDSGSDKVSLNTYTSQRKNLSHLCGSFTVGIKGVID